MNNCFTGVDIVGIIKDGKEFDGFRPGDIIEYCGQQYEVLANRGTSGAVKETCKNGIRIDPFYWSYAGEKCRLVKRYPA